MKVAPEFIFEGKVNHYALLKSDADCLLESSNQSEGFSKTISARAAILLRIVSLEALINRVLEDFWPITIPTLFQDEAKRNWGTIDKWERLPKIIAGKSFVKGERPFQYLKHLYTARNDYVHAKDNTFNAKMEGKRDQASGMIIINPAISHDKYEFIGLLKDPYTWTYEDAKRVTTYCDELVTELRRLLEPRLTDKWLLEHSLSTGSPGETISVIRGLTTTPSANESA